MLILEELEVLAKEGTKKSNGKSDIIDKEKQAEENLSL